jgi:predicted nucleic acid-binding protein
VGALVDSSVFIAVTNEEVYTSWAESALASYTTLFVSPIVLSELEAGCYLAKDVDIAMRRRQALQYALYAKRLDVSTKTASTHAQLRVELRRSGKSRDRSNDLWLAATAREHQLDLLTCNPRDFADVAGLRVVSPTLSQ